MKRLLLIVALLAVPIISCAQTPPQSLEDFVGEELQTETETVTVYWTASGDSAYVHEDPNGAFWRVRMAPESGGEPQHYFHCATQTTTHHLGTVQSQIDSVDTSVQALVTSGDLTPYPSIQEALSCFESYWSSLDSLLASADTIEFQVPESVTYANSCVQSVDNATYHMPTPTEFGIEPQDTLGVITPSGDCAGYGVPREWGVTMAGAAESEEFVPTGIGEGEPIALLHYDSSDQSTTAYRPQYEPCDTMEDMPVCRDSTYEVGAFYQIAGVASIYPN